MSVRDWHDGKKGSLLDRGPIRAQVSNGGLWEVSLRFEANGDAYDLESAKRAAEDALRNLCLDTLAALDGEPK